LDVVCRLCHYYRQTDKETYTELIELLPAKLNKEITDPKAGPMKILKNMRPILNDLNRANPNVNSFEIENFSLRKNDFKDSRNIFHGHSWLDFSKEHISYLFKDDTLLRFPYHSIIAAHFAVEVSSFEVIDTITLFF
jgi:protein tyrosine phosphatase